MPSEGRGGAAGYPLYKCADNTPLLKTKSAFEPKPSNPKRKGKESAAKDWQMIATDMGGNVPHIGISNPMTACQPRTAEASHGQTRVYNATANPVFSTGADGLMATSETLSISKDVKKILQIAGPRNRGSGGRSGGVAQVPVARAAPIELAEIQEMPGM